MGGDGGVDIWAIYSNSTALAVLNADGIVIAWGIDAEVGKILVLEHKAASKD